MVYELVVSGRVQGVGFRWSTAKVAQKMHVLGTVENLNTGQVRIVAKADLATLTAFVASIKQSPTPYGQVTELKQRELPDENFTDFSII